MKNFTAIIVDDEPHAIRTLQAQLGWTELPIEVLATATSVNVAREVLQKHQPDFLFLDVKMPTKGGFELFQEVDLSGIEVIFTTAHDEYALKAFKHQAAGYLMKPVSTDELRNLLEKLIQKRWPEARSSYLTFHAKDGIQRIDPQEILYVSSLGANAAIHLTSGDIVKVNKLLKSLEDELGTAFFRIHHQYLLNLAKVSSIQKGRNAEVELLNGEKLPVSRSKKMEFYAVFEQE
ncbi:LytR/AlgR family response regulator transcription factor [Jiulongibacter sp. NS-SX5]|uniref:LytR/AlgR family response regulator transcription factor n=1 Tax=Jiulongibacter sp. NS-SX5 TaxID=3463854 RepID=UPI004059D056